jgi:hypothetical protein
MRNQWELEEKSSAQSPLAVSHIGSSSMLPAGGKKNGSLSPVNMIKSISENLNGGK